MVSTAGLLLYDVIEPNYEYIWMKIQWMVLNWVMFYVVKGLVICVCDMQLVWASVGWMTGH